MGRSEPALAPYAADVVPAEARGVGMGLYRTYSDVGFVIGLLLVSWIVDVTDNYTWSLGFNAVLVAACVLAFAAFAPETVGLRPEIDQEDAMPRDDTVLRTP